jgi:endonuclease/exonuclease/phosphatase family metal-dependent hydrolase
VGRLRTSKGSELETAVPTIRLITYNILLGGERREKRIAEVLKRSGAAAVALQEVRANGLVHWLAGELEMTAVEGPPSDGGEVGLAVLTRLPVVSHRNHRHPGMLRSHLEVTLRPRRAAPLRLHVVHLAARFGERAKGEARRLRELEAVLGDIAAAPRLPHLLLGDFNSLAPGDGLEATTFFRRMAALRQARLLVRQADGWMGPAAGEAERSLDERWLAQGIDPHLQAGVPVLPSVIGPLTALLPESRTLDRMLGRMIERWAIPRLLDAGYVDCYRHLHPRAHGYTCATWMPAARVDYAFASPEVVPQVVACDVVRGHGRGGGEVGRASDHFPLTVDVEI